VIRKLHFVYNVDATPRALVRDFLHRMTDPATYPCRLCDLTYGRFVKKAGWQSFIWSLPVKSSFYTRDVFFRKYPARRRDELPEVLREDERGRLSVFISREEFAGIPTLEALKSDVLARLNRKRPARARQVR